VMNYDRCTKSWKPSEAEIKARRTAGAAPSALRCPAGTCVSLHAHDRSSSVSCNHTESAVSFNVCQASNRSVKVCDRSEEQPESASSRHKTSAHYRHAILPQPQIERMAELSIVQSEGTESQKIRLHQQQRKAFSTSTWTGFVKRSWRDFTNPANQEDPPSPLKPPPSPCRTMFVTWLNSVPYNEQDCAFLEGLQQTAADFQTHT
jgi:hypothetical protein